MIGNYAAGPVAIGVNPRDWKTQPVPPPQNPVPNGTFVTLPAPPQQHPEGTGASSWDVTTWRLPGATPVSGGPNHGFYYYASQLSFSDCFRYQINPDLANPSSEFSRPQTGEACTVLHAVLLNNVTQHEKGFTPAQQPPIRSHYAQYVTSLASYSNNPLRYVEQRVGEPGTNPVSFDEDTGREIVQRLIRIENDTASETNLFDAQRDQATAVLSGYINWPPLYPLPQGCLQ